jgi:serine phosphatase RsbU (regulator of sigma subunit)
MRKLKIIEHISLDGVVQTTSAPGDDFPYGDWTAAYRSPAGLQIVTEMYGQTCDVLLGRRTYDSWGKGKRFFADGALPRTFALGSTRALPAGILVNVYKLIPTLAEEAVSRAKLEREMEIAREVQERLFPQTFPNIAGIEMAAHCRPAQAVGGDYYDLISIGDGSLAEAGHATGGKISSASPATASPAEAHGCDRLGIAIGDISGKGVSAALLMASLHASLRGQALSGAGDVGIKMANVNRLLYDASSSNRYATFFYAELDCESRTLHYVNGGHNPPAVLRKEDGGWRVIRLEEGGPVVGLFAGAVYEEQMLQLLPGDILLAYTDGISEA